jgi:nucleoside-diphosphate-sugar epimerase
MRRRVLVLGAGGFIGHRLVQALADAEGMVPVAAYHRAPRALPGIETRTLEATGAEALRAVIGEVDAVVNCVGGSAATIVANARALYGGASHGGGRAPRIVHLSSMAVYGSATGEVEECAALKGDLGAYSAAKVEAERIAAAYAQIVLLRPGCVYGPGSTQWSGRIARLLTARRLGDLGVNGDGCCNLVHVDDVVAAILAALLLPGVEGQAFNLSTPQLLSWNDYFLMYARALGTVPLRRLTPRRLSLEAKALAPPLKAAEMLAQRARLPGIRLPPPMPPSLLRLFRQDLHLSTRKAEELLKLRWTELPAGLQSAAAWYHASALH